MAPSQSVIDAAASIEHVWMDARHRVIAVRPSILGAIGAEVEAPRVNVAVAVAVSITAANREWVAVLVKPCGVAGLGRTRVGGALLVIAIVTTARNAVVSVPVSVGPHARIGNTSVLLLIACLGSAAGGSAGETSIGRRS
jgi:hypothetical protein